MEMIRTRRKDKLPKGFAYPLGAEAISIALQGIPQFEIMEIVFSWRDEFWASKYDARIKSAGEITIVEVPYWREWVIFIHAVPAEHSQYAREQLTSTGLQALQAALMKSEIEPQFFRWEAKYDLAAKSLRFA